jgi:hypothetical protein
MPISFLLDILFLLHPTNLYNFILMHSTYDYLSFTEYQPVESIKIEFILVIGILFFITITLLIYLFLGKLINVKVSSYPIYLIMNLGIMLSLYAIILSNWLLQLSFEIQHLYFYQYLNLLEVQTLLFVWIFITIILLYLALHVIYTKHYELLLMLYYASGFGILFATLLLLYNVQTTLIIFIFLTILLQGIVSTLLYNWKTKDIDA